MDNCKSCNTELSGNYCANCGQPAKIKRIDSHYIIHEIVHVLHFEKGILFTIRELLLRPGKNIQEFLSGNRGRLVKPIIFIVITSLIYSLISHLFHTEDKYLEAYKPLGDSSIFTMLSWIQSHYGYSNILMSVFIAGWIKLFFRKYHYNFFEILILLCFVLGMGMLMFAVSALIEGLTHISPLFITTLISTVYCIWVVGQFFDGTKPTNYIKAFIAYMLGVFTFGIALTFLGIAIDLLMR